MADTKRSVTESLGAPVTDIRGIGDKTAGLFRGCGIRTVEELLHYYPRTYDSFPRPVHAAELKDGGRYAVCCRLIREPALKRVRRYAILTGQAADETGGFTVTWFNQPWLKNTLFAGREVVFCGLVRTKGTGFVMEQPGIYDPAEYAALQESLRPRYPLVKGLKNNTVIRAVTEALSYAEGLADPLAAEAERRGLIPYREAIRSIHFPENEEARSKARRRLAYDELFLFVLGIRLMKESSEEETGIPLSADDAVAATIRKLPYALTHAQERVLSEILTDMKSGMRMHRLIQGDVGSGKTILALLAMLAAVENGYQAALMAPTQVLAAQHAETFAALSGQLDLPLKPVLLSGNMKAAERREALERIADGRANCIIGTNALMQEGVTYHRLGLVITDEQHRFGVRQRETLAAKGFSPHILVMSATPIPRTLAMILYGDLQISLLDELPAGRKRIRNALVGPEYRERAYRFIAGEVEKGRQCYVICPMIEEGELEGAENVLDYAEILREALPDRVRVEILHGRMKPEEKDAVMERFAAHETDVLVSTTVIEVGINVPNATVMMIENAERFGLAALHQLRGRVGRGEEQSYCIFVNTSQAEEAAKRLEILKDSNDGFAIADEDLKLRGPGDLFGVRQSGAFAFRVADIYGDADLVRLAAEDADRVLAEDPGLSSEDHAALAELVQRQSHIDFTTI